MTRRIVSILLAMAALGGCARLPAEHPALWGQAWRLGGDGARAQLILGGRLPDDVRVIMGCQPRSGAVDITVVGGGERTAAFEIHSGKAWNRYPGAGIGREASVKLAAIDPVLQAFADTGDLTIVFDQRRIITPNAFAPAHDFLGVCRLP